ncbi:hypothetical protein ACFLR8_00865 [Bacteroidota bacterium]
MLITNLKWAAVIILIAVFQEAVSQVEDESQIELAYHLAAGYSFGGQIVDESMLFESGISFELITNLRVSPRIYYGLGLGYESFDTETFLPLFLSFTGMTKKKDEGPYLSFQTGYSFAWDKNFSSYENYNYRGGLLFSAGIGRMFEIKDKYKILINISLKHQFVRIDYQSFDSSDFTENINYDMISFKIGLLL